jgi:XRE family transcriptional regulator, regulator of sulfur utilization
LSIKFLRKAQLKSFDFSIIKTLRYKHGLSSEDLARRSNLTRATIAKIENGGGNPTLSTIEALADAFDISSSELVRMAEVLNFEEPEKKELKAEKIEGKHYTFGDFEVFHIHMRGGATFDSDPKHHQNTAEVCLVRSGKIEIFVGEQSRLLVDGSAIRYKAIHDHRIVAIEDSEILFIHHK